MSSTFNGTKFCKLSFQLFVYPGPNL